MTIRKFLPAHLILAVSVFLIVLAGASAVKTPAQNSPETSASGISVEANPQLFSTLCALDAAGFDADESTLAEMPSRLALRGELLKMQGPATEALRQFYREHALADSGETLSRYITFALLIGPPPNFLYQTDLELLPPDVSSLEGFQAILVKFYHEAFLDVRWARVEPEYNHAIARYESPVRHIVTFANAYLREIIKPKYGRSFTVYVEPLVGNRTNFRNSGDHYAIVVGTGQQATLDDIQHAYLHFMLDSLPLRYRKEVERKSALLNIAARAPRLPVEYQNDFLAFMDECLIKAVELRLRKMTPEQLETALKDTDESGFILVRPLITQLQKFEKAAPAITYYFPDLIADIDVSVEQKRLQNTVFAPLQAAPVAKQKNVAESDPSSELDRWLAEGDHHMALKDAPGAAAAFEKILAKYPNEPRAVYGLAVACLLTGQGDRAGELFEELVSPPASGASDSKRVGGASDPAILSWSHVYLGRLHDIEDERDEALSEYRSALAVNGAPENARVAAQNGISSPYRLAKRGESSSPQKP